MPPNWANRTLWTGDNLDILRGMNSESVDLIYLDPPFNSNRDYEAPIGSKAAGAAFKDTWTLSDLDVAWLGLIADEQPAIAYLLDAAGRTHGKGMQSYLTLMAVGPASTPLVASRRSHQAPEKCQARNPRSAATPDPETIASSPSARTPRPSVLAILDP